ncbi:MAG: urea ABC transporter permease subunit UrtB, partial [Rhodospirillales bacterium]|nr:urea ABC transporter permease subunit UrtB [Rhodospirillales bacterium]
MGSSMTAGGRRGQRTVIGAGLAALGRALVALALACATALTALPARAQTFEELVTALAAGDFSAKLEAAEKLGALGDARAVPALKALTEGMLFTRKSDNAALISDGTRYFEAATGKALGELPADSVDKARVNNRVRGVVSESLAKLSLFSDDRATRLAAARDAFNSPTPETALALERALKTEKDSDVLAAIRFSLVATKVRTGATEERVRAVEALATTANPQVRSLLANLRNDKETPPEVAAAVATALVAIERRLAFVGVVENIFQGISLGSVLLLAAVGLAITFGVMGVINMAHGEMIMLGAYTAYTVQLVCRALLPKEYVGFYLVMSVPIAFL